MKSGVIYGSGFLFSLPISVDGAFLKARLCFLQVRIVSIPGVSLVVSALLYSAFLPDMLMNPSPIQYFCCFDLECKAFAMNVEAFRLLYAQIGKFPDSIHIHCMVDNQVVVVTNSHLSMVWRGCNNTISVHRL